MINRFEWLKAVLQSDLLDRAKVMASALAIQFGNDDTGQINPALGTLCTYLRMSEDTARRAIADLEKAGWMARTVGRGRGNRSAYVLLSPGKVLAMRPAASLTNTAEKVALTPAKRSHESKVKRQAKGSTGAPKRSHGCKPLYKDEQSFEQKKGGRPSPHLAVLVEAGGWKALEWNKWLSDHRQPPLSAMKALHIEGGYCLPWSTPPKQYADTQRLIAMNIIEWAKGQGHAHAA